MRITIRDASVFAFVATIEPPDGSPATVTRYTSMEAARTDLGKRFGRLHAEPTYGNPDPTVRAIYTVPW